MKANFVQKRKDEHSPGPYEPPAQKIPRKSVIIQKIPNDLDYLRQSLERPWREVHELPCNWDGIKDQDDISQYMHAIKVRVEIHLERLLSPGHDFQRCTNITSFL